MLETMKVANEAAQAKEDGKQRWKSVRQLQMAFAGRRPTRPSAVLKVDGEVTKTPEETKQRWYEHFNSILNIHSHFHQEVIDDIPSYPTMHDLDDPPTQGELVSALGKLKNGKVGGETEIVAELILNGGQELRDRLKSLLQRVWREGTVVEDWKHAELVPIPKKGDLKHCDNWRGISLLDVVGKVFARVVQERLQIIAEKSLPESQCGFQKGRGCTDMIFTARQLVEKCIEHNDSLFILFVDLKKAYDTVPRSALWCVLEKCGVPPTMLRIIRSFHDGMRASVRVGDLRTADIEVKNGLRQGCVLAPTLFNMYFGAVVVYWRERCPQVGVTVKYKIARKLVGDRTAKSRLSEVRVTESQFADDVAVYATTREAFEIATTEFVSAASKFGLTVSIQKTKGLAVGRQLTPRDQAPVQLEEGTIELVPDFTYLGSSITSDGEVLYLWEFITVAMIIGFTERIQTVSEGHKGAVDLFPLQINVSSLRTSEREHPMLFRLLECCTNATVETLVPASNVFDATFGHREHPSDPIEDIRDLPLGERTISSPLLTLIRNDLIPEEIECYTIRIFPVDVPGRRKLFTCNEDNAGADSYFCEHTICIEDDDGKCYF